jgi:DNA-directed RNA polymerase subunit RPC12/RpoP
MGKLLIAFLLLTTVVFGACEGVCNHEYVGTTLVEADCATVGMREYVCSKCEHEYTEQIEALWHTPNDKDKCVRCERPIERNLVYTLLEESGEYAVTGVVKNAVLNDCMIIEKAYGDKPITEISEWALERVDVKKIEFSPMIKNLRQGAISSSFVQEVSFSLGIISIGKGAFENCALLKKVVLHKSLMYVGEGAFSGCLSLDEVVFYGTQADFAKINIMPNNDLLLNSTITFIN